MSRGTSYTYKGYLSRIWKRELEDKMEECQRINCRIMICGRLLL